jgi:hypothetical protein
MKYRKSTTTEKASRPSRVDDYDDEEADNNNSRNDDNDDDDDNDYSGDDDDDNGEEDEDDDDNIATNSRFKSKNSTFTVDNRNSDIPLFQRIALIDENNNNSISSSSRSSYNAHKRNRTEVVNDEEANMSDLKVKTKKSKHAPLVMKSNRPVSR